LEVLPGKTPSELGDTSGPSRILAGPHTQEAVSHSIPAHNHERDSEQSRAFLETSHYDTVAAPQRFGDNRIDISKPRNQAYNFTTRARLQPRTNFFFGKLAAFLCSTPATGPFWRNIIVGILHHLGTQQPFSHADLASFVSFPRTNLS
jgi:hypothetical protein